ncbi:MAG: RsmE family RNA methyltransferase [Spirochaetia bacterium]
MKQIILPDSYSGEIEYILTGETFHHLVRVFRAQEGDSFSAIDREENRYTATIASIDADSCTIRLVPKQQNDPNMPPVYLYQCLLKGKKMDQTIRQSIEAGITDFIPVQSSHCVAKIENPQKKQTRWKKIVEEAVIQSGRDSIPDIQNCIRIQDIPALHKEREFGVFFHEYPLENSGLHSYLSKYPKEVSVLIGPEGGFSQKEVSELLEKNWSPGYLGNTVLRAETATVFALGAIQIILQERTSWQLKQPMKK